jgi:exopolysaccharide biosynthesis WecB/TagA/CpsF family protein
MSDIASTDASHSAKTSRPASDGEQKASGDAVMFMGLPILKRSTAQMLRVIDEHIEHDRKLDIAFCNANTLLQAHDNASYRSALDKMTLINDGIGAELAARILVGTSFPENLNGTDFVPALFENSPRQLNVYLLGAKPDVVAKAAESFARRYPEHTICGFQDGYFDRSNLAPVIEAINTAKPDVLLVAMGNPGQEFFIVENRHALQAPVAMGVGALFDFTAQIVPRAPMWMRKAKIEWLFRLSREPKRLLHRYTVGIGRFIWICLKLRLRSSKGIAQ